MNKSDTDNPMQTIIPSPVTVEGCFDSELFCKWWDDAHGYQLDDELATLAMGIPDDGWALDCLVERYNDGMSPQAAVDDIMDGYDPTP